MLVVVVFLDTVKLTLLSIVDVSAFVGKCMSASLTLLEHMTFQQTVHGHVCAVVLQFDLIYEIWNP